MKKHFSLIILILGSLFYSRVVFAQGLRIISLTPATTEILFALGLDDEIIAVTSFCNYPPRAQTKDKIGSFSQPNIEKILFLKPDIIFCTGLEQAVTVKQLKQLNLQVCVSDPANISELFSSILQIGRLTRKEKAAETLVKKMQEELKQISSKVSPVPLEKRPKVFIEVWHDPLMTIGSGSFVDELIALAGGINIAHDIKRSYSYFSAEELIRRNPDFIILTYMTEDPPGRILARRIGWHDVAAVKNNRIYNDIDPDLLLRPGPRLIEGLKALHKKLYS